MNQTVSRFAAPFFLTTAIVVIVYLALLLGKYYYLQTSGIHPDILKGASYHSSESDFALDSTEILSFYYRDRSRFQAAKERFLSLARQFNPLAGWNRGILTYRDDVSRVDHTVRIKRFGEYSGFTYSRAEY